MASSSSFSSSYTQVSTIEADTVPYMRMTSQSPSSSRQHHPHQQQPSSVLPSSSSLSSSVPPPPPPFVHIIHDSISRNPLENVASSSTATTPRGSVPPSAATTPRGNGNNGVPPLVPPGPSLQHSIDVRSGRSLSDPCVEPVPLSPRFARTSQLFVNCFKISYPCQKGRDVADNIGNYHPPAPHTINIC
jgi:hypothetical protein